MLDGVAIDTNLELVDGALGGLEDLYGELEDDVDAGELEEEHEDERDDEGHEDGPAPQVTHFHLRNAHKKEKSVIN
jgi:hypothetical protein